MSINPYQIAFTISVAHELDHAWPQTHSAMQHHRNQDNTGSSTALNTSFSKLGHVPSFFGPLGILPSSSMLFQFLAQLFSSPHHSIQNRQRCLIFSTVAFIIALFMYTDESSSYSPLIDAEPTTEFSFIARSRIPHCGALVAAAVFVIVVLQFSQLLLSPALAADVFVRKYLKMIA